MALPVVAAKGGALAAKAVISKIAASKAVKTGAAVGAGALAARSASKKAKKSKKSNIKKENKKQKKKKGWGIEFDFRLNNDFRIRRRRPKSNNKHKGG